ncbi:MAG: DUF4321 domain-containing protein [Candidatus Marinimicrobia bacterium]|nr:DUF4321 domain-containing protein [Candidatus Neomarinimicrobiota bacterium]
MKKRNSAGKRILTAIGVLFLGAMIGSLLGEILKLGLPEGVVKEVLLRSIELALGPAAIDLLMFSLTIGFTLKVNLISLVGLGTAYYLLKNWR